MNPLVEVENLGIRFWLERQDTRLVRDVVLRPCRRRERGRPFWALRDVSLRLERGGVLGVIGANGAGKTTLLMALAGIYTPDEGRVRVQGRVASLLEVGAGFRMDLTGRENVYLYGAVLGIPRREIADRFDEIVDFSELEAFIDAPLRAYSFGMRMRLGFATAMCVQPDLLLVDEALSIGDSSFQRRALERIETYRRAGGTLVYVSHDMSSVGDLCDACLLLDHGERVQMGDPIQVIAAYWERTWGKRVATGVGWTETLGSEPLPDARRWGSGEVTITRFLLRNSAGEPTRAVPQGEPCVVEMGFRAERPIADLLFQVSLFQGARTVAILPSQPASMPEAPPSRTGRVVLEIDTKALPLGTYQLDAEVRDAAFTRMYDHLDKFLSLEIGRSEVARDAPVGIPLPCRWTVMFGEPEG